MSSANSHASPARIALGFAAVYILWGSTYLAMRFAVATLPPLLMAGTRHLGAGLLLYLFMRLRGTPKPQAVHWRSAALLGFLLLVGNGMVAWAEVTAPSGITALILAAVPFFMVLLNALEQGRAPRASVLGGLLLGVIGLGILVLPTDRHAVDHVDPVGVFMLLAASLSWAVGSLYAHRAALPASTFLGISMEMVAGGCLLWLLGLGLGEGAALHLTQVSLKSALAMVYLIVFGSLLGFTAYVWLLKVTTPARASTYAFVNPVIAVFLGWLLADEHITPRIALAGALIVAGVGLILYFGAAAKGKALALKGEPLEG